MLRRFKDMNQKMHQTGSWKEVAKKKDLLQMVAKNNLLFTDIISKLGIMERFDLAWKNTDCSDIYEHLRSDMEITNRNNNLQVKVHDPTISISLVPHRRRRLAQDSLKLLLEVCRPGHLLLVIDCLPDKPECAFNCVTCSHDHRIQNIGTNEIDYQRSTWSAEDCQQG